MCTGIFFSTNASVIYYIKPYRVRFINQYIKLYPIMSLRCCHDLIKARKGLNGFFRYTVPRLEIDPIGKKFSCSNIFNEMII